VKLTEGLFCFYSSCHFSYLFFSLQSHRLADASHLPLHKGGFLGLRYDYTIFVFVFAGGRDVRPYNEFVLWECSKIRNKDFFWYLRAVEGARPYRAPDGWAKILPKRHPRRYDGAR
jgi:hypothetical protein